MSLIGVDIGTSNLKAAAYDESGEMLAVASVPVRSHRPRPGWWEVDPNDVWNGFGAVIRKVAAHDRVRKDPAVAMAIAASGEEAFGVDAKGLPIGNCIMSGDTRGAEVEAQTAARASKRAWYRSCGHVPDRMDPVNRLLWLRGNRPKEVSKFHRFLNWHDYVVLRLVGRAVTDTSLASKWLVYDFAKASWSNERLRRFDIDPSILPAVQFPGTAIGPILSSMARDLGLPRGMIVSAGGHDSCCASLGAGVSQPGTLGLSCGTWEVVVAPVGDRSAIPRLAPKDFPFVEYVGEARYAVKAQSPNGSSVLNWASAFLREPVERLERMLGATGDAPGPLLAAPHLSGALCTWVGGRGYRAFLLGLSLSTQRVDVVKALLEGVAYDLSLTLDFLRRIRLPVRRMRATGGGTRCPWWMQLKADICRIPIELVERDEAGTFGAALLAGASVGVYPSAGQAGRQMAKARRCFEPSARRSRSYGERLEMYQAAVKALAALDRQHATP